MKKLILLSIIILCLSLVGYGQQTNTHLNFDTIYIPPYSSVDIYICDDMGLTYNQQLCQIIWDIDGILYYDDTLVTIYSDNNTLYRNLSADTMYIQTTWLDENGNPYKDSCVIILNTQLSIQELQQTSEYCHIYDMKGSLVYEGVPIRKKGLFIYKYQLNDKYYTRKIYTL